MKLLKYGLPFAALALLASCSNDTLDAPQGQDPAQNTPLEKGTYLSLNIAVPSTGTRADDEEGFQEFNHGTAKEYAVKSANLYIYNNDKNCIAKIGLDAYWDMDGSDEITTKSIKNIRVDDRGITKLTGNQSYYALVILNEEGMGNDYLPSLTSGATNNNFDTWKYVSMQSDMKTTDGYFVMTNALGWDLQVEEPDLTAAPEVLVPITNDNLYFESEADGSHASVNIYVQRVLAKVSLGGEVVVGESSEVDVQNEDYEGTDYLLITGWKLDIGNRYTYPVQNLNGQGDAQNHWYSSNGNGGISISDWTPSTGLTNVWEKRFVGGVDKFQRVFWAVDPNYDADATSMEDGTPFRIDFAYHTTADEVDYCLENTFNLDNMLKDRSTRVIIKGVYFADWEYTGAPDESDINQYAKTFLSYNGLWVALSEDLNWKTISESTSSTIDDLLTTVPTDPEYDENADENLWNAYVGMFKALNLSVGSTQEVNVHYKGEVYYDVIIRHFSDNELALAEGETVGNVIAPCTFDENGFHLIPSLVEGAYVSKYPAADRYLLGRYGVVRNNWYELAVNAVYGPGTNTPPGDNDETTDDDPDKLMLDVNVNILSWAKRSQNVELGK